MNDANKSIYSVKVWKILDDLSMVYYNVSSSILKDVIDAKNDHMQKGFFAGEIFKY